MLGRRREQIFIIGGLIGLNVLLGWLLGRLWKDYRSRTEWLSAGVAAERAPSLAAGSNQPAQPQSFVEIVDRNVFSPLRGRQPAQPQEQAEARAPKLPLLFGTMNLGEGRFALMSPGDQSPPISKRVLPGEEIGGYKLVSIGTSNVVVEWQEKKITVEIAEPASRGPGTAERTANVHPSVGTTAASTPGQVMTVGSVSGGATPARAINPRPPGPPLDVPEGTIVGGKRKVVVQTPFGPVVQWQDVAPSGTQPTQQSAAPNK
jgi:hypothetical protein